MSIPIKAWPDIGQIELDPKDMHKTLVSGLYEEIVSIGGKDRKILTYLPEGITATRPALIVVPPACENPVDFLIASDLCEFAQKEQVFVFVLEAENSAWNYDGTDADFLNVVSDYVHNRKKYIIVLECIYAMGFGDGSTVVQQAAVHKPQQWSGIATCGNIDDAIKNYIAKNAFADGPEQMPVYMEVTSNTPANDSILSYWKQQNDSDETVFSGEDTQVILFPKIMNKYRSVDNEKIAQIRLNYVDALEECNLPECIARYWHFLQRFRRHRAQINKHLRYFAEGISYGCTYHEIEHEGWTRTWYEYVPESVKNSQKPVPIMVVLHGRTQSSEIIFDLTMMSRTAEEYGFIALFPRAGVYQMASTDIRNVPYWLGNYKGVPFDDVGFIRKMVADVATRNTVDMERIYACGFSSGGMMSHQLAVDASDLFAAVCLFSGICSVNAENGETAKVPQHKIGFKYIVGDKDKFFGVPIDPTSPYNLPAGSSTVLSTWAKAWDLDPFVYTCSYGDWKNTTSVNKQGIPLLHTSLVRNMDHAVFPSESYIAYEHCIRYARKNGELYYMGRKVL